MSAAAPLLFSVQRVGDGKSRARKKWGHGLMDKALWSQSLIGFMALELWSQDYLNNIHFF